MTIRAVIGLGSNIGDRDAHLSGARREIRAFARELAASSLYDTAPVGGPPQDDFVNAALFVEFEGTPRALLEALLQLERRLGRDRSEDAVRWGPRVIDLDLLFVEGQCISEAGLVVPHPRLHERAFALSPMLEIVPDAVDPRTHARFAALANTGQTPRAWPSFDRESRATPLDVAHANDHSPN